MISGYAIRNDGYVEPIAVGPTGAALGIPRYGTGFRDDGQLGAASRNDVLGARFAAPFR